MMFIHWKKIEHNTIVFATVFHDLKSKTKDPFLSNFVHKSKTVVSTSPFLTYPTHLTGTQVLIRHL